MPAPAAALPVPGNALRATALMLALVVVLWGANWSVMKTALAHSAGPLWIAAMRFLSGAACVFAVVALRGRLRVPPRADWPIVLSIGIVQMLGFAVLVTYALRHVPAGRSAVLAYTTSLWVTPLAVLLLGERVSRRKALGTALGLIGVLVLFNPAALDWSDGGLVTGHALLVASAVLWAVCIVHIRGHRWTATALELAPWQMLLAGVAAVPLALAFEGPTPGDGSAAFWLVQLYIGPIATGLCFWIVILLNTRMPATTMATAMLAVPVFGILSSSVLLGERLELPVLAGMAIILAGMGTVVTADRR